MRRLALGLAGATAAALGIATAALADKEKIAYTAAGQAAARAAVISRADLGNATTGWTGGKKKPEVNTGTGCANFNPKQSDLVLIGAARTDWKHGALEFDSEAQVLQTPAMVKLDWQRTVLSPQVLPCFKQNITQSLTSSEKFVSIKQIPIPKIGDYSRLYRTIVDVKTTAGTTTRVLVDELLLGRGSTEISVTTTAAGAPADALKGAEIRLARLLTGRVVI